jgi:serine protease Do
VCSSDLFPFGSGSGNPQSPNVNPGNTNNVRNVNITVEQADRPALSENYYVDEPSGLMTAEGVSQFVMPSSVLINVFANGQYFSPISYGSGVVMSANGYIITNAHVVDGGTEYSVTLSNGESYEAKLLGMDIDSDVAVLKIEAEGLTPAVFGKTVDVKLGEEVAIIANSGSTFDNFATFGHISNTDRLMASTSSRNLRCFQTDAAVNAGTSGGPIVNMYGQVIGIVVGKYINLSNGMYENIGFGLQIDTVLEIASDLIAFGYIEGEVKIGVYYTSLDNITADAYNLPSGLLVEEVIKGGSADAAGILPFDIITSMNGKPVFTSEHVTEALRGLRAGDIIPVEITRRSITGETDQFTLAVVVQQKIDLPANDSYNPDLYRVPDSEDPIADDPPEEEPVPPESEYNE